MLAEHEEARHIPSVQLVVTKELKEFSRFGHIFTDDGRDLLHGEHGHQLLVIGPLAARLLDALALRGPLELELEALHRGESRVLLQMLAAYLNVHLLATAEMIEVCRCAQDAL